jgi:hypothetical protein
MIYAGAGPRELRARSGAIAGARYGISCHGNGAGSGDGRGTKFGSVIGSEPGAANGGYHPGHAVGFAHVNEYGRVHASMLFQRPAIGAYLTQCDKFEIG